MLEKLHDKFEDERTDLEKEESNARHAYEMLIQVFAGTLRFAMQLCLVFSDFSSSHPEKGRRCSSIREGYAQFFRGDVESRSVGAAEETQRSRRVDGVKTGKLATSRDP